MQKRAVNLPQMNQLRATIRSRARQVLAKHNPEFLRTVQELRAAGAAPDVVLGEGRKALAGGLPKSWTDLLMVEMDYELAIDKMGSAVQMLGTQMPAGLPAPWDDGRWTSYHLDQFILKHHAWLERFEKLITRVCRVLLRGVDSDWKSIERRLVSQVAAMKKRVSPMRHALAHGGGSLEAIAELKLWEVSLIVEADVDTVEAYDSHLGHYRERWHDGADQLTLQSLEGAESITADLNARLLRLGS